MCTNFMNLKGKKIFRRGFEDIYRTGLEIERSILEDFISELENQGISGNEFILKRFIENCFKAATFTMKNKRMTLHEINEWYKDYLRVKMDSYTTKTNRSRRKK